MKKLLLVLIILIHGSILFGTSTLALKSVPIYEPKHMERDSLLDDIDDDLVRKYYTEDEKLQSFIYLRDGLFYDLSGELVSTAKQATYSGFEYADIFTKYVLDVYGNLYINKSAKNIRHSYFLNHKMRSQNTTVFDVVSSPIPIDVAVADAGWLYIDYGKIIEIKSISGHYMPSLKEMINMMHKLVTNGISDIMWRHEHFKFSGKYLTFIIDEIPKYRYTLLKNVNVLKFSDVYDNFDTFKSIANFKHFCNAS